MSFTFDEALAPISDIVCCTPTNEGHDLLLSYKDSTGTQKAVMMVRTRLAQPSATNLTMSCVVGGTTKLGWAEVGPTCSPLSPSSGWTFAYAKYCSQRTTLYDVGTVTSFTACEAACMRHPTCNAYSYSPATQDCSAYSGCTKLSDAVTPRYDTYWLPGN